MAFKPIIEKLPPGPDIDILVMGKSGHGKSSTGNAILGKTVFKAVGGDKSVTKDPKVAYSNIDGRVIKVVDIPGLCDTDLGTEKEKVNLVIEAISGGLRQFPRGLTALVLVLTYSTRFTKEEREAIIALKSIMGDDIIRTHTICVFTHGKNFLRDHGQNADFDEWCREQRSAMKKLMEECEYRCVLFENLNKDPTDRRSELLQLVSKIDGLSQSGERYTLDKFHAANDPGDSAVQAEITLKLEKYSREVGLIKDDLDKIKNGPEKEKDQNLEELKQRVESVRNDLDQNKRDEFTSIKESFTNVIENIASYEEMIAEEDKLKLEKEKIKSDIEQMAQEQREAFEKMMSDLLDYVDKTETSIDDQLQKTDFAIRVNDLVKSTGIKLNCYIGMDIGESEPWYLC